MTTRNYQTPSEQPQHTTPHPSERVIAPQASRSEAELSNAELRIKDRPDAIERVRKGFERKNEVEAHRLRAAKVLQAERATTGHDLSAAVDRTTGSLSQLTLELTIQAPRGSLRSTRGKVLATLLTASSILGVGYSVWNTIDRDPEAQAKSIPNEGPDAPNPSPEPQEEATEEGDAEDTENDEGDLGLLEEDIKVIASAETVANELEEKMTSVSDLLNGLNAENEEEQLNTILSQLAILSLHLSDLGLVCEDTPENPLRDKEDCDVTMSQEDFDAFKNHLEKMIAFKKLLWNDPSIQKMRQTIKGKKDSKEKKGRIGTLFVKQKKVLSQATLKNKDTKRELIEIERILRLQLTIILDHFNREQKAP